MIFHTKISRGEVCETSEVCFLVPMLCVGMQAVALCADILRPAVPGSLKIIFSALIS
ncbi:MAG: hypothetical protein GY795_05645 [Desulfobacterales bacterium]|nr:hypothetical protein [Desulfobacterales bacterium]